MVATKCLNNLMFGGYLYNVDRKNISLKDKIDHKEFELINIIN